MDINNLLSEGPAPTTAKPPPPQQQHHQVHHIQQQSLPSTPVQHVPAQSFHDYGQHPQASPTRGRSHDYGTHQMPQGQYGSPRAYQNQPPYAGRPAPPPLQPLTANELRSPSLGSGLVPGPSPYRPTPTSSISTGSGGYPFTAAQQTPTSPEKRHQYPPSAGYTGRDAYQPGAGPGVLAPSPYMPQTPPVGTPGGTHPYLQRTSTMYSATTPTSAHGQQQYAPSFGSPVSTAHPLPPHLEHTRQQSQPSTPLGPPPRQSSIQHGYAQPPSPYQQRISAPTGPYPPPPPISQQSPHPHHLQASPSGPAQPTQRLPSNHNIYDNPITADSGRTSHPQSDRDRSLSVSPKTRIPSLPSSSGQPSLSLPDWESRPAPINLVPNARAAVDPSRDSERLDRAVTPAKRKLEDRDLRQDEIEKQDVRPPPFSTPDGHTSNQHAMQLSAASASPVMLRKKRKRFSNRPRWAQRYTEGTRLNAANFVLRKHAHNVGAHVNGQSDVFVKPKLTSRHASPDEKRSTASSHFQAAANPPPATVAPTPPPNALPNADGPLGPWESSITGLKPHDEMGKTVADWLFFVVLQNGDKGEISSRNVQFEIEAKMGTLISKDTNERINIPVRTECIIQDSSRFAFRSNMTEAVHKSFNDFLNELVKDTFPAKRVAQGQPPCVQILYKHRKETDKFFELPAHLRAQLPACIQNRIPLKHTAKVRVTFDQVTGQVVAMIIKARVDDLDIHFPSCPFDCRISVNLEMPWGGSLEELEKESAGREALPDRKKDRLSYSQSHYQVDLTQVSHTVTGLHNAQRTEREHEIEIEVSTAALLDQGDRMRKGQPHQYGELVEGLVDNVRVLARKAREFKTRLDQA